MKKDSFLVYCNNHSAIHLEKKFDIPFKIQAYWCEVPLDTRCAWKEIVSVWEDSHNEEWVKYNDKVIAEEEYEKL